MYNTSQEYHHFWFLRINVFVCVQLFNYSKFQKWKTQRQETSARTHTLTRANARISYFSVRCKSKCVFVSHFVLRWTVLLCWGECWREKILSDTSPMHQQISYSINHQNRLYKMCTYSYRNWLEYRFCLNECVCVCVCDDSLLPMNWSCAFAEGADSYRQCQNDNQLKSPTNS